MKIQKCVNYWRNPLVPNITICTAFFDIGRGDWGGPSYLRRSVDDYFANFEKMLRLDNQMIVYTSNDLMHRFDGYKQQKDNLTVVGLNDWKLIWREFRPRIEEVFASPDFVKMLHQPWNPEYWCVDYVMVNFLKSWFVNQAIAMHDIENDLVAWIDFGYAREHRDVPTDCWNFDFDPDKIHMFTIKPNIPSSMNIYEIITINDVIITGCHIVAGKMRWHNLILSIYNNIDKLLRHNIIDDDQSLLFMAYLENPEMFEIRKINHDDWFCIFRDFNDAA